MIVTDDAMRQLLQKANADYAAFTARQQKRSKTELIGLAPELAPMRIILDWLRTMPDLNPAHIANLSRFRHPLVILYDHWMRYHKGCAGEVLRNAFDDLYQNEYLTRRYELDEPPEGK